MKNHLLNIIESVLMKSLKAKDHWKPYYAKRQCINESIRSWSDSWHVSRYLLVIMDMHSRYKCYIKSRENTEKFNSKSTINWWGQQTWQQAVGSLGYKLRNDIWWKKGLNRNKYQRGRRQKIKVSTIKGYTEYSWAIYQISSTISSIKFQNSNFLGGNVCLWAYPSGSSMHFFNC